MKIFIASDLHGSSVWCRKMLESFERSGADRLLLLGDLLYHGPRNDLPDGYSPKEVLAMLNSYADRLLCVRGNCDAEVDQMVLEFPIMADYAVISDGNATIYATHGHKFDPDTPPPLRDRDVLLYGHIHIPVNRPTKNFIEVNPGSVSLPKLGSPHSYAIYENGSIKHFDLSNDEEFTPAIYE